MVEDAQAGAVFRALADATRRQILVHLRSGDLAAGQIAERFPISGPSVSRHLAVLRSAGLVTERRAANRLLYSLVPAHLHAVLESFLTVVGLPRAGAEPSKARRKHSKRPAGKGKARPKEAAKHGPKGRQKDRGMASTKSEDGSGTGRPGEPGAAGGPESCGATATVTMPAQPTALGDQPPPRRHPG